MRGGDASAWSQNDTHDIETNIWNESGKNNSISHPNIHSYTSPFSFYSYTTWQKVIHNIKADFSGQMKGKTQRTVISSWRKQEKQNIDFFFWLNERLFGGHTECAVSQIAKVGIDNGLICPQAHEHIFR